MRLAGQLICIVLPASAVLLTGLAVGVVYAVHGGADEAGSVVAQRLTSNGEQDAVQAAQRLDEHGQSLARVVAQVAPSFVISDDLMTLEAMTEQLAADTDVAWAAIRDHKDVALAAAWDGGKGVKAASRAAEALRDPRRVSVRISADGKDYGSVDLLLSKHRLEAEMTQVAATTTESTTALFAALTSLRDRVVLVVAAASVAILAVLGVAFVWIIRSRVSRPLAELEMLAAAVAVGDLSHRAEVRREDEVGALAGSLNRMAQQLDAKGRLAESIADGDLTVVIPIASDRDTLGRSLERMATSLKERIGGLASQADRLATMASNLVEAASQLDQALVSAGTNTQAVASAMQEFQASFQEIASSTAMAVGITQEAAGNAAQAADGTVQLIAAGKQVAEITVVIANVASRTKLLALNATIEAARAGAAGRGFTVVAGEVKTLASETSVSTGTIDQRVASMVQETERTRDSIAAIVAAMSRIREAQRGIAASIDQQTTVAGEVVCNLTGLSDATRGATAASTSLASSARDLAVMADSLRKLVATYRL
jgi:methyl-accepting chemotaxis protein